MTLGNVVEEAGAENQQPSTFTTVAYYHFQSQQTLFSNTKIYFWYQLIHQHRDSQSIIAAVNGL